MGSFVSYHTLKQINCLRRVIGSACFFLLVLGAISELDAQVNLNVDSQLLALKKLPQDTNRVNSYLKLGKAYNSLGVYDSAIYFGTHALQLSQKLKFTRGVAVSNVDVAVGYWYVGNYSQALSMNYKALDIFDSIGDQKGIAQVYNNMGIVYASQENFAKALECYFKTLTIKKELGDSKGMGSTLINIGATYDKLKEFDKSFAYYREALVIKLSMKDEKGEAICLMNIGLVYSNMENNDSALFYYNRSLELRRKINDRRGIVSSLGSLGQAHVSLHNYSLAEQLLIEADSISNSIGTLDLTKSIWLQLSILYDSTNRPVQALVAYKKYTKLKDSINLQEAQRGADKLEMNYKFEKERLALQKEQEKKDALAAEADKRQMVWIIGVSTVLVVVTFFSLFLFTRLRIIRKQKGIIERQKILVEERSREVSDSIAYAKRIQYTLLAHDTLLRENLPEHFVLFQPKDIVSGDFYWGTVLGSRFYLAVCDSTGHGVPGAFMSLLNISFLNEAITEKKIVQPNLILDYVREKLIGSVSLDGAQDGMDGTLFCIDKQSHQVTYASANSSPLLVTDNGIVDCASDKMPIGKGEKMTPFQLHTIKPQAGEMLYLFTDGFADQFGGEKGKKFRHSQLKERLSTNKHLAVDQQKEELQSVFDQWKGELEQVDDVLIIGIRF